MTTDNIFAQAVEVDKSIKECKGLYWRASESQFMSAHKSVECRKSLRLLKRMSCPGCEKCEWMFEFIQEEVYENNQMIDHIIPGKLYQFRVFGGVDYESGHYEIDGSEFFKVEETG